MKTIKKFESNTKLMTAMTEEDFEHKLESLLRLVDSRNAPFSFMVLESRLTREQEIKIYDLMDEAGRLILEGTPMNHVVFERKVYAIVPAKNGDYHFAEEIVSTLNDEGRYQEIFNYYKDNGMNINSFEKLYAEIERRDESDHQEVKDHVSEIEEELSKESITKAKITRSLQFLKEHAPWMMKWILELIKNRIGG